MESITINIKCQALRNTLGLVDHYYLEIGDKEYHLGFYAKGKILPLGTTKGAHLAAQKVVCSHCYQRLMTMIEFGEDVRLFDYYPFVNCESLTTGISVQLCTTLCSAPFIAYCFFKKYYGLMMILFLITIICILSYSKYVYSRTIFSGCPHQSKPALHY